MKKSKPLPSVRLIIHREQASPVQKAAWCKFWTKIISQVQDEVKRDER